MSELVRTIPADAADAIFAAVSERIATFEPGRFERAALEELRAQLIGGVSIDARGYAWLVETLAWQKERATDLASARALDALITRLTGEAPADD